MATPSVDPATPSAQDELNTLLQTLHEQGLLRLANDLAASHSQWMPALGDIIGESAEIQGLRRAVPALVETAGLLQALHQQGLLRFARDIATTQAQWAPMLSEIAGDYLDDEELKKALRNLVLVLTTLWSRIEPEQLRSLALALGDGLQYLTEHSPGNGTAVAPGLAGLYRMSKDEALWRGLMPVIEALKVFTTKLAAEASRPAAASGKEPRGL